MNKYIVQKLKKARISKKLKQSDVAKLIGVKGNTLSNYENGVSEPDIDTFCKLCEIYDLDTATVLGEAYGLQVQGTSFDIKPSEIQHIKNYRKLDDRGKLALEALLKQELASCTPPESIAETIDITYYHQLASAGNGEYLFDDLPTDIIKIKKTPEAELADFVLKVRGDSMEPTIYDEELVLVKKTSEINIGEIGIFVDQYDCYVKELGKEGLISHNTNYPIMLPSTSVKSVGKVLGSAELSS